MTILQLNITKFQSRQFQYLESLAEMVRSGIEAANDDLRKENEDKLMQEVAMLLIFHRIL